jgi:hypothetical protein
VHQSRRRELAAAKRRMTFADVGNTLKKDNAMVKTLVEYRNEYRQRQKKSGRSEWHIFCPFLPDAMPRPSQKLMIEWIQKWRTIKAGMKATAEREKLLAEKKAKPPIK